MIGLTFIIIIIIIIIIILNLQVNLPIGWDLFLVFPQDIV